ncbi:MAG: branched-chain amino acid transaminase [Candidatus Gracilibacteria bacterium]
MATEFKYAYIRKQVCLLKDASIPIQSKAVQYGLGVFTGIRGNWNPKTKNLYLFRLEDHYDRLKEASNITGLHFDHTYQSFKKIITDLIKKNQAKEDIYLRITLYAGSTQITPRFDNEDDDMAVYMISLKDYFHTDEGLNVCISSWRRIDDDAISTKAKITGSYSNSALAKTEAIRNGYDEALFLNRDGKICEATGANIFGIKKGIVFTPPLSANNLNGITRRSILELFKKEMKLEIREEEIDRSTLYIFDELFLTGTAARIAWIKSVDKKTIGNGEKGPIAAKIQTLFKDVTSGKNKKYQKWLTKIF